MKRLGRCIHSANAKIVQLGRLGPNCHVPFPDLKAEYHRILIKKQIHIPAYNTYIYKHEP